MLYNIGVENQYISILHIHGRKIALVLVYLPR